MSAPTTGSTTTQRSVPQPVFTDAEAGAKEFPDSQLRRFNYFNPAKRNRGGERDLDAIVMAAVHGLDRAALEYPIRAGIILMIAEFDRALVEEVEKKIHFVLALKS